MKKLYHWGGDFFMVVALATFAVAIVSRVLGLSFFFGVTPEGVMAFSLGCAILSIASSVLYSR